MPALLVVAADPLQAETAALEWLPRGEAVTRRSGDELTADVLFTDLGQPGMFAETRVLLYTDVLAAKLNKKESERTSGLLASLPRETHLAAVQVIQEETKAKSDTKFKSAGLRLFAEGGKLLDLRAQAEGPAAVRWIAERASARHGLRLSTAQAARILAANAGSPAQAEGELLKLALLREGTAAWSVPDTVLEEVLSGSPAAQFYELVDRLLEQPARTQSTLSSWFKAEPETFRLIFELKRRLAQARSAQRGEQVYPPFAARSAQALARRLAPPRLNRAFEALARLEHGLKSGRYPAESSQQAELTALQLFAAELAAVLSD
jgi:DNA polymerase III delta subunit